MGAAAHPGPQGVSQATWAKQAGPGQPHSPPPSEPGDCGSGEECAPTRRAHHCPGSPLESGAEPLSCSEEMNTAFYSVCVWIQVMCVRMCVRVYVYVCVYICIDTGYVCVCVYMCG